MSRIDMAVVFILAFIILGRLTEVRTQLEFLTEKVATIQVSTQETKHTVDNYCFATDYDSPEWTD